MPRIAQSIAFHPSLQFRYSVFTSKLPGAVIHARAAEQPSCDNSPVTINYMSGYFKMKGKTTWNDITLSCYQFEGITVGEIYKYLNKHHIDVNTATEKYLDQYKHVIQLFLLNPMKIPIGVWRLFGSFISSVSWGNMDYSSDEIMQCDLTISYDYAEYDGIGVGMFS